MITLPFFLDIMVGGILWGALYSLISMGINLQFGVIRIMNIANGEFLMLGAYITYFSCLLFGFDPLFSLLISGSILFILGILIHMGLFNLLFRMSKTIDELVFKSLLVSFGLSFVIQNMAMVLWTSDPRGPLPYLSFSINIGGAFFALNRVIIAVASLIINLIMCIFFRFTRIGLAIRAVVEEPSGAQLVGVNIFRVHILSFGLGALLSGCGGTFLSILYSIDPFIGPHYLTIALVVMMLGGVGSFMGNLVGGIFLGYASYITMRVIHPSLTLAAIYTLLTLVILIKPEGLFKR